MTTLADVKAVLDPFFAGRVYRDAHPRQADPLWAYATVAADVARTPTLAGDERTLAWTELAQVDVWQRGPDEDDTLIESVVEAVDGLPVTRPGFRARVDQVVRFAEETPDAHVVHHAITLRIARAT